MKKRVICIFLLVAVFLFTSQVSGAFILGNKSYSIDNDYAPGDSIGGWINISLQKEPIDSKLETNFGGSINISDLIDMNDEPYNCFPPDCREDYSLSNGQAAKSFQLINNEKKVSFQANGRISSINSFSLDMSVENPASCISPLKIYFFNNEAKMWEAWKFNDDFSCAYSQGRGCFSDSENPAEMSLDNSKPFCEKITLLPNGRFYIGAWVKKGSTAWVNGLLKMDLYSSDEQLQESCNLPEPSESGGNIGCIVEYDNTEMSDYYVCLRASAALTNYKTRMESADSCGFYAIPGQQTEYHDYDIFAKSAKFSNIGLINFNQDEYEKISDTDIKEDIMNYLNERFNGNCTNGCSIPLRIKSSGNANITLSNLTLTYSTGAGPDSSNKIYDASPQQPKISSDFLILDLDYANFSIPSGYGNRSLTISLGGRNIASKSINIAKAPLIKNLIPTSMPAGARVKFTADVSSPANNSIVSYSWDFGDDSSEDTTTNSATHAYNTTGIYTITLSATDSQGLEASKEFTIFVGSARNIVNSTLKKYRARVTNVTRQIESEPDWIKEILKEEIGIEYTGSQLTELEREYSIASSDEEYSGIMISLSEMSVPSQIKKGSDVSFPILIDPEEINLRYLAEMGAGDIENLSEDEISAYKDALIAWNEENIEMSADSYSISAYYDTDIMPILNYFKLKMIAKNPGDEENYLVINDIASFAQESPRELEVASGLKFLSMENREIEFAASGDKSPLELAIYLSPEFRNLNLIPVFSKCNSNNKCEKDLGEDWKNCRDDCKPWGWAIFYFFILIFFAFIIYIVLEEWYKRRYENHLFKNRNDLYNLVNFIHNALTRGMQKHEIERNLKRSGWSSEQITYSFKKVKGKRTGMPIEIGFKKK